MIKNIGLWLEYLKEKKNTCFKKHIASPFLVSWISSLQLELLLNAEK
jgi:hypothetical protein